MCLDLLEQLAQDDRIDPLHVPRSPLHHVGNPERLAELEDILIRDPTVGYWIRELYIDGSASGDSLQDWLFGHAQSSSRCDICGTDNTVKPFPGPILADKLKKLHSLTFSQINANDPRSSAEGIYRVSEAFASRVRSLTFKSCWGHKGFFLALMHAFPLLHELNSLGTRTFDLGADDFHVAVQQFQDDQFPFMSMCTPLSHPVHNAMHVRIPLNTLTIQHHDFVHDFGSLICSKSLRAVQTLEIYHTGARLHAMDDISNVILPECGRALRRLKISIVNLPHVAETLKFDVMWIPSLTHLKNLRILELQLNPLHHPFICSILETCANWCTKLSSIIFHISFNHFSDEDMKPAHYQPLDRKFRGSAFRSLKEVRFVYSGPSGVVVKTWLQLVFPNIWRAEEERGLHVWLDIMA
ncbi:hypothetical protein EUX98_g3990 [Antrodiella citrinella]|uniref:F-box domain-containing protein n=1 Tax=Antrodiella citrinella TaxID=2447956 RepID=A0A4S4MV41_9APHY|nr:hypothetical protein EUX98_g3990 [Antrodiella citrinella]